MKDSENGRDRFRTAIKVDEKPAIKTSNKSKVYI